MQFCIQHLIFEKFMHLLDILLQIRYTKLVCTYDIQKGAASILYRCSIFHTYIRLEESH